MDVLLNEPNAALKGKKRLGPDSGYTGISKIGIECPGVKSSEQRARQKEKRGTTSCLGEMSKN